MFFRVVLANFTTAVMFITAVCVLYLRLVKQAGLNLPEKQTLLMDVY